MKKQTIIITLIALAALLLAGCKMNVNTTVNEDGSGTVAYEFGFTAEEEELIQSFSGETAGLCTLLEADIGDDPDLAMQEEKRGNETWCVVNMTFEDLDELEQLYMDEFDAEVQRLELTEDDQFYYDISVDMSDADMSQITGLGLDLEMTWKLTVPGSVGSNNADQKSGKTLTWDLPIGQVAQFQAESSPSKSWLPCSAAWLPLLLPLGALLVLMRRKKQ